MTNLIKFLVQQLKLLLQWTWRQIRRYLRFSTTRLIPFLVAATIGTLIVLGLLAAFWQSIVAAPLRPVLTTDASCFEPTHIGQAAYGERYLATVGCYEAAPDVDDPGLIENQAHALQGPNGSSAVYDVLIPTEGVNVIGIHSYADKHAIHVIVEAANECADITQLVYRFRRDSYGRLTNGELVNQEYGVEFDCTQPNIGPRHG